jgi:hypothetical protein
MVRRFSKLLICNEGLLQYHTNLGHVERIGQTRYALQFGMPEIRRKLKSRRSWNSNIKMGLQ